MFKPVCIVTGLNRFTKTGLTSLSSITRSAIIIICITLLLIEYSETVFDNKINFDILVKLIELQIIESLKKIHQKEKRT